MDEKNIARIFFEVYSNSLILVMSLQIAMIWFPPVISLVLT
jgi:hypothetical protein